MDRKKSGFTGPEPPPLPAVARAHRSHSALPSLTGGNVPDGSFDFDTAVPVQLRNKYLAENKGKDKEKNKMHKDEQRRRSRDKDSGASGQTHSEESMLLAQAIGKELSRDQQTARKRSRGQSQDDSMQDPRGMDKRRR